MPCFPLFPDKGAPRSAPSSPSPEVTSGSTKDGGPKGKTSSSNSAAGGLLQSVLAQKGREILPSALPQSLLPLLGRGLSISSLPGSHSLEHQSGGLLRRVKPPASAAASGRGSDPTEPPPPPTDAHSQLPHTQTHTPVEEEEEEAKITTVATMPDEDAETGTPSPGMNHSV